MFQGAEACGGLQADARAEDARPASPSECSTFSDEKQLEAATNCLRLMKLGANSRGCKVLFDSPVRTHRRHLARHGLENGEAQERALRRRDTARPEEKETRKSKTGRKTTKDRRKSIRREDAETRRRVGTELPEARAWRGRRKRTKLPAASLFLDESLVFSGFAAEIETCKWTVGGENEKRGGIHQENKRQSRRRHERGKDACCTATQAPQSSAEQR